MIESGRARSVVQANDRRSLSREATGVRCSKFHRARDMEARQYTGELPFALTFDDGPETPITKLKRRPEIQDVSKTTGRALWHFDTCRLHVLYSNIDNHLIRIMLMAPGSWLLARAWLRWRLIARTVCATLPLLQCPIQLRHKSAILFGLSSNKHHKSTWHKTAN